MNTYGTSFRISVFGESHGHCIGTLVKGCPPGLALNEGDIQTELDRRKPGKSAIATQRKEEDRVKILGGVFDGKTTGAPIAMIVENKDTDSSKYDFLKYMPRPGHADFTVHEKYHGCGDFRGGGMFSGRSTASLVMGGAVGKKILSKKGIEITAHTIQVGNVKNNKIIFKPDLGLEEYDSLIKMIKANREKNEVSCADSAVARKMVSEILNAKKEGDSVGGVIECIVRNVPVGAGEPYFDTLEGEIAKMMFAIPAVKGIEFGAGFKVGEMKGSRSNDQFCVFKKTIRTKTNYSGGILGGISNGMPIVFRVAVKPTASIAKKQQTVRYKDLKIESLSIEGRHDPCIVPRAVPVVEAGAAIVMTDLLLRDSRL
ncbi:MAG: chorismate synthase [Thermoplasmata archaeon]